MRFRAWAGSVLVVMWSLGASSQVEASFLTMGHIEGSGIVWDGDSDVRTSNIFGGNLTSITSGDPTNLEIGVTLTGDNEANIFLRLLFTADLSGGFVPPPTWTTLNDASTPNLLGEFNELSSGQQASGDSPLVALSMDFNLLGVGNGPIALSSTQQGSLNTLLSTYPQTNFYVGILAEIQGNSMPEGALITFNVTTGSPPPPASVPEPSTALLLGVGAVGMIGRRFRKRA